VVLVVMGVAGSGKSTVAQAIVRRTGWRFQEGDDLHPPANVVKMHAGVPLTDADRWPWLRAVAAVIGEWLAEGASGVVSCSALKRSYRDVLVDGRAGVRLLYLRGSRELIDRRLRDRHGHFMPEALLGSQFATLEEPGAVERPIVLDVKDPPEVLAARALRALHITLPVTGGDLRRGQRVIR
jgi:carbohydrate kinase (thermoresistant glucokinase family)